MDIPLIATGQYLEIANVRTRYFVFGDAGSPVILVHGLGGLAESWSQNWQAFAQKHRVYVLDLPGFGLSAKPEIAYCVPYFAQFLHDFMNALSIDRASLVGNSMGGGISLQFALQFPKRVDKLVLVDSLGFGREGAWSLRLASLPWLGELLLRPNKNNTWRSLRHLVFQPQLIRDDVVEMMYRIYSLPGAQKSLLAALRSVTDCRGVRAECLNPIFQNLHKITMPVLIIWGKADNILPASQAYVGKEKIAHAQLCVWDECGHLPQLELPEKFNQTVLEFLD